ncbi:MAG: SAM-dependent methyltransferase [Gammaproteobacteria bacterium]|nr:SAM-dependent methyltransferase [Gammaproteobacteria bacterium]MDH4253233.1 SAM-dependent methyltransferase [Gammaproteobacteria bacterium]MDH5308988.1 SAM-dependent methyltransferase [Gammaproteobacteria bacterium]
MQLEPIVPVGLPVPDPDSLAHSERVAGFIRERIAEAGGSIGFAEYMQHALYAPGLGYYAAGASKFGPAGDFVTAPEISPAFGRVLAAQCAEVLSGVMGGSILELGAGTGTLAATVLARLDELGVRPAAYQILEVSADLADRQRRRIGGSSIGRVPVAWLDRMPESFRGVVLINEVADALPVERFLRRENGLLQVRVATGDAGFVYATGPADARLAAAVHEIEACVGGHLAPGYCSEVSLGFGAWLADIVNAVQDGVILLFDYGVSRREYYAPDRDSGWLRCHFRHHAHEEPLIYPGIQDITAWVDFSAAAEAAAAAGASIAGYVTQALFLLHGGLENEMARFQSLSAEEQIALSRQIRQLMLPGEMGERFKCLALAKGSAPIPPAVVAGDRAHTL